MFCKQHFEEIARTMHYLAPRDMTHDAAPARIMWASTVNQFAHVFAQHNPRFDRKRFIRACGGES